MIEVNNLTHRYGPLTAVEKLSFRVQAGEVLGLLGPNGAGKTTTLRAIVGLLSPSQGNIAIGGHRLDAAPIEARRLLGYLPEAVSLYRDLTVEEMLRSTARIKGVEKDRVGPELGRVVEICGLESVHRRMIGYCSRGFRQRIGLAQALIGDPPALILDEPTVGLDPAQIVEIRERIRELAPRKAVILSTHILPEASQLCSKLLILSAGRCVAEDTPENLEASLRGGTRLRVVCAAPATGAAGVLEGLAEVESVTPVDALEDRRAWRVDLTDPAAVPAVVGALVGANCGVLEVSPERLGLETVFLRLVRTESAQPAEVGGE
jgi:ABC-2 type transport system ATP-binding protein